MGKIIGVIVGVLTMLGILWGGICTVDNRYAKAADQKVLQQTVNDKLDSDHLRLLRERKWQMEREFPSASTRPASIDSQIQRYNAQEKVLEQRLGPRVIE